MQSQWPEVLFLAGNDITSDRSCLRRLCPDLCRHCLLLGEQERALLIPEEAVIPKKDKAQDLTIRTYGASPASRTFA